MAAMSGLWAVFTILAAGGQTVRNATQRGLTAALGPAGATHVRFLFGLPFALLFLAGVCAALGRLPQIPSFAFWPAVATGAIAQIVATALMLLTMEERSFVVSIAYLKTEPIPVAFLGLIFLNDPITLPMMAAILISVLGVVLISWRPGVPGGLKPALLGLGGGVMF